MTVDRDSIRVACGPARADRLAGAWVAGALLLWPSRGPADTAADAAVLELSRAIVRAAIDAR